MPGQTASEIEVLIRARYPIIYVLTWEEMRVTNLAIAIAQKRDKRAYEWTCTMGLVPAGTSIQSEKHVDSATKDPLAALDAVVKDVEPALYLFQDFHPFMGRDNMTVVRRLREVAMHLKNTQKTILLVSPVLVVPPELEKDMTVVDFELPSVADFEELLGEIVAEVRSNPSIVIDLAPDAKEKLLHAVLGLTLTEAENVFAKALVQRSRLDGDDIALVFSEKKQIIRKSGLLEYYDSRETLSDVGGLDALKDWLRKRSLAFTEKARSFGLPAPKGVLLLGVQGCGKSLSAKAVASLWGLPLLRLDVGRVFNSLVGSSEENIRRAIKIAESISPVVLWVDEIDKAFVGAQSSALTDSGTTARVVGTFLTWLAEKTAPVFVVATANDISQLPPELLRKGRLDEIFFVDLPDFAERKEVFAIHLEKRRRNAREFDLDGLARKSQWFSGAEIEQAIISALFDAFAAGHDLTTADIEQSLRETVPLSKTMGERIEYLRAWSVGRARRATSVSVREEAEERAEAERQVGDGTARMLPPTREAAGGEK